MICYLIIFTILFSLSLSLPCEIFASSKTLKYFFLVPKSDPTHFYNTFQGRAKQLYNAGYKSLVHLANADPEVLIKTIDHLSRRQAKQIVSSAKVNKQSIFLTFMLFCSVISLYLGHKNKNI